MRLDDVIEILKDEQKDVRRDLKKLLNEEKRVSWISRFIENLLRRDGGIDYDIWYHERLDRELSEAITILEANNNGNI